MSSEGMAIQLSGLTKRFGKLTAVDGVSMMIPRGGIVGLAGPAGAGKTTLLRMLVGSLLPDSGAGLLLGLDLLREGAAIRRCTGSVAQRPGLYHNLTVAENLSFYGGVYGLGRSSHRERCEEVLARVGLGDQRSKLVAHLSDSWRQWLALACAIAHRPPLLLLDCPTKGLDPISRRRFWRLLYDLAAEGATILVTTPYMDEAERCDLLGLMLEGKLMALERPSVFREHLRLPTLEDAFVSLAQRSRA